MYVHALKHSDEIRNCNVCAGITKTLPPLLDSTDLFFFFPFPSEMMVTGALKRYSRSALDLRSYHDIVLFLALSFSLAHTHMFLFCVRAQSPNPLSLLDQQKIFSMHEMIPSFPSLSSRINRMMFLLFLVPAGEKYEKRFPSLLPRYKHA